MNCLLRRALLGFCLLAPCVSLAATLEDSPESLNGIASVDFSQDEKTVTIKVKTGIRNKMCGMTVKEFSMVQPVREAARRRLRGGFASSEEDLAEIRLTFVTPANQYCLMAFGPHRGSITFDKGAELPRLKSGRYKVVVNGGKPSYLTVN